MTPAGTAGSAGMATGEAFASPTAQASNKLAEDSDRPQRAVVFAYHNVGVRCLRVLLARGLDIALVVTHEDNPAEAIWFDSVASLCREHGINCITPQDPADPALMAQVGALKPDWIFSFYYRHMLPQALLDLAPRGAYNMHGSLLPRYRGRVPVNWAVLHGETETGATLHRMVRKADAGAIVAQNSVPILPDDTAYEVFGKLCVVAEKTLWDVLPAMLAGAVPNLPNDLSAGSYFGGRKPEDGRIDWEQPARAIYNLHRAVAPPYPGAWTEIGNHRLVLVKARLAAARHDDLPPGLHVIDNRMLGIGGDGQAVEILALEVDGQPVTAYRLATILTAS